MDFVKKEQAEKILDDAKSLSHEADMILDTLERIKNGEEYAKGAFRHNIGLKIEEIDRCLKVITKFVKDLD